MKILDLVLKHKYYKMYEDGIKTEEYREIKNITVGKGNPDWGAPGHKTFIIKLGKRIETK